MSLEPTEDTSMIQNNPDLLSSYLANKLLECEAMIAKKNKERLSRKEKSHRLEEALQEKMRLLRDIQGQNNYAHNSADYKALGDASYEAMLASVEKEVHDAYMIFCDTAEIAQVSQELITDILNNSLSHPCPTLGERIRLGEYWKEQTSKMRDLYWGTV